MASLLSLSAILYASSLQSVSARTGNTTCKLNDQIRSQANWYYNLNASSPCLMFESLYRICSPSFSMFGIQDGGFEYYCQPESDPSDPCCCSSVAFNLFSACKSCQFGTPPFEATSETYGTWLGACSSKDGITITNGSLPSHISPLAADINLPPYAFIPPSNGSDSKWDYFKSKENATAEKSSVPPDFTARPGLHIGAKVGIIVGAVIVLLGLALGVWLFRRNRVDKRRRNARDPLRRKKSEWSEMRDSPDPATSTSRSRSKSLKRPSPPNITTTSPTSPPPLSPSSQSPFSPFHDSPSTAAFPPSSSSSSSPFRDRTVVEEEEEDEERPISTWESNVIDAYAGEVGAGGGGEGDEESYQGHGRQYHARGEGSGGGHMRERSFGGGGEHGDGMYGVAI